MFFRTRKKKEHIELPLSEEEIQSSLTKIRNEYGDYSPSVLFDKQLLKQYFGIVVSDKGITISNEKVERTIQNIPKGEIQIEQITGDLERMSFNMMNNKGLWHNEVSLVDGGIEHDTYNTCELPLFDGSKRRFYYAIGNDKRSQIILKYLSQNYDVNYMQNEFPDDDTVNIWVEESVDNEEKYYFLYNLGTAHALSVYGWPADRILSVVENDTLFRRGQRYDNYCHQESELKLCHEVFNLIKTKYNYTDCETAQHIYNNYYVVGDGSTFYKSRLIIEREEQAVAYRRYGEKWKNTYDEYFKKLIVEDGYKTRWVSELTLYQMVVEEYEDALYQYTTEFLQGQSLDIYIPSLNVGIEYQGLQHYKPVKLFGGEEGFKATVERDQRKKKKCEDNGVTLIEWKYDEPISKITLREKLKDYHFKNE